MQRLRRRIAQHSHIFFARVSVESLLTAILDIPPYQRIF
jgi:hypothetical protein